MKMKWQKEQNLALNNEMRMNDMKIKYWNNDNEFYKTSKNPTLPSLFYPTPPASPSPCPSCTPSLAILQLSAIPYFLQYKFTNFNSHCIIHRMHKGYIMKMETLQIFLLCLLIRVVKHPPQLLLLFLLCHYHCTSTSTINKWTFYHTIPKIQDFKRRFLGY